MPAPQRTKVMTLLSFNPDSAGGLMNVDIVFCGTWATAGEALALIGIAQAVQPEALLQMHVLNDERTARGRGASDRVVADTSSGCGCNTDGFESDPG